MNVEAYRHQVGGHCRLLKPKDSSKVCKPLNENEFRFYDKLASLGAPNAEAGPLHILRQFVPKYYGVTEICVHAHYQHEKQHNKVNSFHQQQYQPTEVKMQEFSEVVSNDVRSSPSVSCGIVGDGIPACNMAVTATKEGPIVLPGLVGRQNSSPNAIPPYVDPSKYQTSREENAKEVSHPSGETAGPAWEQRHSLLQQLPQDKVGMLLSSESCAVTNVAQNTTSNKGRITESSKSTNDPSSPLNGNSINGSCNNCRSCLCIRKHIVLEDLVFGFRKPCVLDLKMGVRQRTLGADAAKEQRQRAKSLETTSHILGFRLCGCQYYNRKTDTLCYRDKYWGRKLTKGVEQLKHYRFWSSSLLWVYDGGLTDPEARRRSLDIRMIDFANTIYLQDNPSPDEEYLFGLRNLIDGLGALLASCHTSSIHLPVSSVPSPVGATLCTASTSSRTIAFAEGNSINAHGNVQQTSSAGARQDEAAGKSQDQLCREKQRISLPSPLEQCLQNCSRGRNSLSSQTSQEEKGASIQRSSQSGLQESAPVCTEDVSRELLEPTSPCRTDPLLSTEDSSIREGGIADLPPICAEREACTDMERCCKEDSEELDHSYPALVDVHHTRKVKNVKEPDCLNASRTVVTKASAGVADAEVQATSACDRATGPGSLIQSWYSLSCSVSSSAGLNKDISSGVVGLIDGGEHVLAVTGSATSRQDNDNRQSPCAESISNIDPSSGTTVGNIGCGSDVSSPPGSASVGLSSGKESISRDVEDGRTGSEADSMSHGMQSKCDVLQGASALNGEDVRFQAPPGRIEQSRIDEAPFMYTSLFRRSVSAPLLCERPVLRGEALLNGVAPTRQSSGAWGDFPAMESARGFVASFFGAAATSDSGVTVSDDAFATGDSGFRGDDQMTNGSTVNSDTRWRFDASGASRSSSLSADSCREGEDAGYEAGDDARATGPRRSAPRSRMQDAFYRQQEVHRLQRSRRRRFEGLYGDQRLSDMGGVYYVPHFYHPRQRRLQESSYIRDVFIRKRSSSSFPRVSAGAELSVGSSNDTHDCHEVQPLRLQKRWPGHLLQIQRQSHRSARLRGSGIRPQGCWTNQRFLRSRGSDAEFGRDSSWKSVDASTVYEFQHRKGAGVRVLPTSTAKTSVSALRRSSLCAAQSSKWKLLLQKSALRTLLHEHELRLQHVEQQALQQGLERQELLVLLGIHPGSPPADPQNSSHLRRSPLRVSKWCRRREGLPVFASLRKGACAGRNMSAADLEESHSCALRGGKSSSGRRHSFSSLSGATTGRYGQQAAPFVAPLSQRRKMPCQDFRTFRRRSDTCDHPGGEAVDDQSLQTGMQSGGNYTSLREHTKKSPLTGMDLDAVLRLGVGLGLEMGMSRGFGNRRARPYRFDNNRSLITVPTVPPKTGHSTNTQVLPDSTLNEWGDKFTPRAFPGQRNHIQRKESQPLVDWIVQQYCGVGRNAELPPRTRGRNDYSCRGGSSIPSGISAATHGDRERTGIREGSNSTSSAHCKQEQHYERRK